MPQYLKLDRQGTNGAPEGSDRSETLLTPPQSTVEINSLGKGRAPSLYRCRTVFELLPAAAVAAGKDAYLLTLGTGTEVLARAAKGGVNVKTQATTPADNDNHMLIPVASSMMIVPITAVSQPRFGTRVNLTQITELIFSAGGLARERAGEARHSGRTHRHEHGVDRLFYAYQEQEGGIAEALGLAERFGRGDRIVVMLADNVFERSIRLPIENFERQEQGGRIVLAKLGEPEHLRHLGVAELDGNRVIRIVEKPERPPSEYAVTGVYFYDEAVWDVIPTLKPSGRGELEITDVNNWFIEQGTMEYDVVEGFWGDAGESIDAYYAVNDFVRANGANKQ